MVEKTSKIKQKLQVFYYTVIKMFSILSFLTQWHYHVPIFFRYTTVYLSYGFSGHGSIVKLKRYINDE